MADPFDLNRFIAAQAGVIADALTELHAGQKRSHWMWFVFPQLRGLGVSPTAQRYGIADLDEANAYRTRCSAAGSSHARTSCCRSSGGRSSRYSGRPTI